MRPIEKVLIIDDDPRNIFALKAVLQARGYACLSAMGVSEALALLENGEPVGIILMDMMMPDIDGYEGISRVHAMGYRQPILAVTAQAMPGDKEKCLNAGATDYVSKPVDVDKLLDLLKQHLK
jgi:two-component system cell cycle response regulator DivK